MASELRVDTLKDSSGNNSVGMAYVSNGSAKAWINFNGSGTIAERDSFNVTGLTDNGTGDYTVEITNDMLNANYAVSVSSSSGGHSNTDTMVNPYVWASGSVSLGVNNNAGAPVDRNYVNFAIHGDLA